MINDNICSSLEVGGRKNDDGRSKTSSSVYIAVCFKCTLRSMKFDICRHTRFLNSFRFQNQMNEGNQLGNFGVAKECCVYIIYGMTFRVINHTLR